MLGSPSRRIGIVRDAKGGDGGRECDASTRREGRSRRDADRLPREVLTCGCLPARSNTSGRTREQGPPPPVCYSLTVALQSDSINTTSMDTYARSFSLSSSFLIFYYDIRSRILVWIPISRTHMDGRAPLRVTRSSHWYRMSWTSIEGNEAAPRLPRERSLSGHRHRDKMPSYRRRKNLYCIGCPRGAVDWLRRTSLSPIPSHHHASEGREQQRVDDGKYADAVQG